EAVNNGQVKPGHVVGLRGLGPKGTPGMGMATCLVFALDGAGLSGEVAVVTDGQQSGLSNKVLVVNEVLPEAADGGPLALVENGDIISIDVEKRVVNLEVPEEVLEERRAQLNLAVETDQRGWLQVYQRLVRPFAESGGS